MRIISAIQPTGDVHIGNYLGAIKQWASLQDNNKCIFFISDLHSLTVPYDQKTFSKKVINTAITYLAAGIDPEKSIFFIQSHIKEHAELCWLLDTICPMGDLKRMTQYKEKAKQFSKNVNAGLFNYPVLMAADILLYKTELVPVGKDQVQHVELTRTLARRFNKRFGKTFIEPKVLLPKLGAKIMALNNPTKKMSKSMGPESYISLFEEPKEIERKVMSAVTDSDKEIKYNPSKKPGISNMLVIYSLFSETPIKELEREFKGKSYYEFKKSLTNLLIKSLKPFRERRNKIISKEKYIKEILKQGEEKARIIAQNTMKEVKEKMGLI
jgi:tryptophanyl-tRNA synthetase